MNQSTIQSGPPTNVDAAPGVSIPSDTAGRPGIRFWKTPVILLALVNLVTLALLVAPPDVRAPISGLSQLLSMLFCLGCTSVMLVRAIRGDQDLAGTPLILLDALAQEHHPFAGLASGADQYLIKPVSLRELVTAVQFGAEERRLQMQALLEESTERGTAASPVSVEARGEQEA